ncbi:MAG TPA: hypothetical protein VKD45_12455 [Hyphomicrobiaceae bacterium]|nr:hypothetical protein [Hyphomicrobiaceae bacterium]
MADEDLIITVDSLDEPFDTTAETAKPPAGPTRIKVPWKEEGKTAQQVAREASTKTATDDDAVADLRSQLNNARERTAHAEQVAREADAAARNAAAQVDRARTIIADTTIGAINEEIASATTESQSIRTAMTAAYNAGEFEKVAELQEKQADVRARLLDANRRKQMAEQAPEVTRPHSGAVREPPRDQPPPRAFTLEERKAQQREQTLRNMTPKTRAWLEAHPDVLDDPVRGHQASYVHQLAISKGLQPDTDEYFRFAEREMGYEKSASARPAREAGGAVAAAPLDRGGTTSSGSDGTGGLKVTLTRGELEAATDGTHIWNSGPNKGKPIGAKEMARRKAIMTQEGRYANPAVS